MNPLTNRQKQILAFIERFLTARGYPPTRLEIATHFGMSSANAAQCHVLALQRKGAVKIAPGLSRGIRVL